MYIAFGGRWIGGTDIIGFYDDESLSVVPLKKTDDEPNEPEDGYISIFRLYEMSYKYGIELEMLTDMEYSADEIYLSHNAYASFNPMYLLSETEDMIVLKTILWNPYWDESYAIEAVNTVWKKDGKWERTVELKLPSVLTVND